MLSRTFRALIFEHWTRYLDQLRATRKLRGALRACAHPCRKCRASVAEVFRKYTLLHATTCYYAQVMRKQIPWAIVLGLQIPAILNSARLCFNRLITQRTQHSLNHILHVRPIAIAGPKADSGVLWHGTSSSMACVVLGSHARGSSCQGPWRCLSMA
jgi:hypothetical protein